MSILKLAPESMQDDSDAIAKLQQAFNVQKKAFAANRNPTLAERRERLQALIGMMAANKDRIEDALASDFGAHPKPAADLIEILGVMARAAYVLKHLVEWTAPSVRDIDTAVYGSAKAYVQYQPKGVIGNMVPWNFPFDLSVGPMTEMHHRQAIRIYPRLLRTAD
jgi:coniferyl-aldehyde dehydrogenase